MPLIADGGIRYSGDIAKAHRRRRALRDDRRPVRRHRGVAGRGRAVPGPHRTRAIAAWARSARWRAHGSRRPLLPGRRPTELEKLVPEGIEGRVPYKGSARRDHPPARRRPARRDGLHAAARNIDEMRTRPKFVEITSAGHAREPRARRADHQGSAELPLVQTDARTGHAPATAHRHPRRPDPDPRFRLAVHPADRAPRARGDVYCEIHPYDVARRRSRARSRRSGIILSGGPESTTTRAAARAAGACSSWACRCSASATACRRWRSSWAAGSRAATSASSATPRCARAATPRCSTASRTRTTRGPRHAQRLDEPRRQGRRAAARLQADGVDRRTARSPAWPTRSARFYGVQFHPEVTHTEAGRGDPATASCSRSAAARPTGSCANIVAEAVARDPRAGRRRGGDPRPVGRRRFVASSRR